MTTPAECLDCGSPTPPTIDGPLCHECAVVAAAILPGGVADRIEQLREATA